MIPLPVRKPVFSLMSMRLFLLAIVLLAVGCTRGDGRHAAAAPDPVVGTGADAALAGIAGFAARPSGRGFASLPDHGDLLAYPGKVVRQDGAYTMYRADLSEEHALRAIASGRLRVATPEGEILDFQYDRHIEHASGDWTWIGHRPGREGEQAILTFGAEAAFGSIAQAGKPPLRLTVRDGASWLVKTDPAKVAGIANAATRPQRPDYHIVAESELPRRVASVVAAADGATTYQRTATATATAATVDLIIGYTAGFANAHGGASGATTRLNYLVDVANAGYVNSKIDAQVRMVKAMQVAYTDTNSNDTALEQLSGYKSGTGPVTPNPAFNALRAAREQYHADLVSLVRDFRDPEQDGCGLAFLLGGGLQGIDPDEGWDELGYSVLGDGSDVGSDGKNYYCQDETLAHELGHNMGAAHDKETAKGDDHILDNPDDYGAYTYSFGYKTGSTAGNFYTIMAYGDTGQTSYRTFSTPLTTFCGGRSCGTSGEDNARTLSNTAPVVAGFRASPDFQLPSNDVNGDSRSDLLWFKKGVLEIWHMSGYAIASNKQYTVASDLIPYVTGTQNDYPGADIAWRDGSGEVVFWVGGVNGFAKSQQTYAMSFGWRLVAAGDHDGDGRADLIWRSAADGRVMYWSLGNTQQLLDYQDFAQAPDFDLVTSGDYNADGLADLFFRRRSDGITSIWLSSGSGYAPLASITMSKYWVPIDSADYDADGDADVVWRSSTDGRVQVWIMEDGRWQRSVVFEAALDRQLVTAGDFNADRLLDMVWRKPDGSISIWLNNGTGFTNRYVGNRDSSWQLVIGGR
jgi:hypothetical protein